MARPYVDAFVHAENRPLGAKWNAVVREAMRWNPDYIFITGQDDFYTDALVDRYAVFIKAGVPFAGIGKIYMFEPLTQRAIHFEQNPPAARRNPIDNSRVPKVQRLSRYRQATIGAGRLLHRSWFEGRDVYWQPEKESGLDLSITKTLGLSKAEVIPTDDQAFAVDVKTAANIWSLDAFLDLFPEMAVTDPQNVLSALPEWDAIRTL
jgi:hypothetical protein